MCGFAGFSDYSRGFPGEEQRYLDLARRMAARLARRGPDGRGAHFSPHCVLGHARLAVQDPAHGAQPMTAVLRGQEVALAYNGELYNCPALRAQLEQAGHVFSTRCDTEVLLAAYLRWGLACPEKLTGIFAFAVDDPVRGRTVLCRDRFGVKPLFYALRGDTLVFGSEIKALLEYPGIRPVVGTQGLREVWGLGPARTPGCGVFEGIREVKPGHLVVFDRDGLRERPYFTLEAAPHQEDYPRTVERVRQLLTEAVEGQLSADAPLCAFLSGGLDSSVVTAIAARKLGEESRPLDTYSFEFSGNDRFFVPSSFQPERDEDWARLASRELGTRHTTLTCESQALADSLFEAVLARDLPGMADVDGSLLHFCRLVKERHTVALCGECADELFGGYPWYFRPWDGAAFPWSGDLALRQGLLKPELRAQLDLPGYVSRRLEESLAQAPLLPGEGGERDLQRQMSYLNTQWFMATLLDRKDRCSMWSGLEVRVPYADHRLAQYLYNVPWEMKARGGQPKALLRDAAAGLLPEKIRLRRKSPYPKTYDPGYEALLKKRLGHVLRDSQQPIHQLLDPAAARALLEETFDYGRPWFGQLMAGPQLLAYLLQMNFWLLRYKIYLRV